MKKTATALITLGLLTAGVGALVSASNDSPSSAPIRFGMGAAAIGDLTSAGVKPDYGTFWVGPWTLKHGWGGPDSQMASMRSQGVTPAIHFYYWGDDISQSCIENGCWSNLHSSWKDKAGWQQLATQLVDHMNAKMGGQPVVIFLETEFNKANVQTYEPLDGYLAEKARFIKQGYPAAEIVLALGSWNTPAWPTWDRAAAASDLIGVQGMRGSTRDSLSHYQRLYEDTLANAREAKRVFSKPVFLQDIALSSYPEPEYLRHQEAELREFFTGMDALKAAGVQAMVYRTWRNYDNMDPNNYYGYAERHWGFAYSNGVQKASAKVWIDGVKAERAGAAPAPGPFEPTFRLSPNVNEWWIDAYVRGASPVKVEASHNGGAWQTLTKTDWNSWAKSFHAPAGGTMAIRATDAHGQTASESFKWLNAAPKAAFTHTTSGLTVTVDGSGSSDPEGQALTYAWAFGDGGTGSGMKTTHTYAKGGTYTVTLTVSDGTTATKTTATATVQAPNQAPTAHFTAEASGTTVSLDARGSSDPDGDTLSYVWDLGDGARGTGSQLSHTYERPGTYTVRLTVDDGRASATTTRDVTVERPAFAATYTLSQNVNQWWVDVRVDANAPVTAVDARVNGGSWVALQKTSWGTWAKSFHAPAGSIEFRATSGAGQNVSEPMPWLRADSAPAQPSFKASFTLSNNVNQWWVDVRVGSGASVANVEARVNGGSWVDLQKTSWGTWAKSFHAPAGTIEFRASDASGAQAMSGEMPWLKPKVGFTPKSQSNAWWVEVAVDGKVTSVEARKDGGGWVSLPKTSWGTWAKSFDAKGTIEFRATLPDGSKDVSGAYRWG